MSHYFENDLFLKHKSRLITYVINDETLTFQSDSGVFSKKRVDTGSHLLIETVLKNPLNGTLLDLGCGIGVIGLTLTYYNPNLKATLIDINQRAVMLTKQNAEKLNIASRVKVLINDGLEKISDMFETIVINPPIRAGKQIVYQLYNQAQQHLKNDGKMYLVVRKNQGSASTIAYLQTLFTEVNIINRRSGYHIISAEQPRN